jgi:hypothetical protein
VVKLWIDACTTEDQHHLVGGKLWIDACTTEDQHHLVGGKLWIDACTTEDQHHLVGDEALERRMFDRRSTPFFTKFEYWYQNNAKYYADFETVEKNAENSLTKKLWAKKGCKIGDFPLLYYKFAKVFDK